MTSRKISSDARGLGVSKDLRLAQHIGDLRRSLAACEGLYESLEGGDVSGILNNNGFNLV